MNEPEIATTISMTTIFGDERQRHLLHLGQRLQQCNDDADEHRGADRRTRDYDNCPDGLVDNVERIAFVHGSADGDARAKPYLGAIFQRRHGPALNDTHGRDLAGCALAVRAAKRRRAADQAFRLRQRRGGQQRIKFGVGLNCDMSVGLVGS